MESYGPINETRPETAGAAVRARGVSLVSSGGAMVYSDNLRPEEKLEHQAEQTQYEKQLPFTRSEPYPHPLARSFDALEQVMGEQQATQPGREFVALRSIFPDRDVFFSGQARRGEGQPNEADHYI